MNYLCAVAFLYLSHAIPSAPGMRARLFERLGARNFRIFYSTLSSVAALWFIWAYVTTDISGMVYAPLPGSAHIAVLLMPLALFAMVARIATPFGELSEPRPVRGIYRITRFPGSLGVLLWSLIHLAATGDLKRVLAFFVFALIALTALIKNERVLAREERAVAKAFRSETALLPFGKGVGLGFTGLKEVDWKVILGVAVLYVGLLVLHPFILGVGPLDRL